MTMHDPLAKKKLPPRFPTKSGPSNSGAPVEFLRHLRPRGPWTLTAIIPDGPTTTITARSEDEARDFVRQHNGRRNLYYAVNPLRRPMDKKASKKDVVAIEYMLADLDPNDDESPEQAKRRYLQALKDVPEPTMIVDSGNGVQCLWRLQEPIKLPPANGVLSEEALAAIADIEERAKALMERLGAKAGTQNIDRILRLPGTLNLPNAKKKRAGRRPCEAKLLRVNNATFTIDDFPLPNPSAKPEGGRAQEGSTEGVGEDELCRTIRDGGGNRHGSSRSEAVWYVVNEMLKRGYYEDKIVAVLLDRTNGISAHTDDQANPEQYAEKQVEHALKKLDFDRDAKTKIILPTSDNVCVALLKLGIRLRYDEFSDRTTVSGLDGFTRLEDAAVDRIWLRFQQVLGFAPSKALLHTVIGDVARLNGTHPVREYLDALVWDGVPRVDTWLTTYGGAEDNEYVRAVGALMLIAAVRRVRHPGCKFDEMLILETPMQGTEKSAALAILAVRDDWFTDQLPLNAEPKRVIEEFRGKWIVEAAEMSGMRRAEIEHVKAMLSRQNDRARLAYGRLVTEVPRQCVIFGTTNSRGYLRDTTGNRRFWPVRVKRFDIKRLKQDRDQLWAEAAAREAQGGSIRLDRRLWATAAEEQATRTTEDPYVDELRRHLGQREGKIATTEIWKILNMTAGQRSQEANRRLNEAMLKLGWKWPNKSHMIDVNVLISTES